MDGDRLVTVPLRQHGKAASLCEPLDGSAPDCAQVTVSDETPATEPDAIAELWDNAKAAWTTRDFPKYGSREWIALDLEDPRRLAAVLEAAELWRKFGDEEALIQWFREASQSRQSIADRRTRAELDELAKPKPPHQLHATPGWPPIALPGQPGKYLTYRAQKAA